MDIIVGGPYSNVTPSFLGKLEYSDPDSLFPRSRSQRALAALFLMDYTNLMVWYVHRLGVGKTRRQQHGIVCIRKININFYTWQISNGYLEQNIRIGRTEFATILANALAELDAATRQIMCILPGPIADEIVYSFRIDCEDRIMDVV